MRLLKHSYSQNCHLTLAFPVLQVIAFLSLPSEGHNVTIRMIGWQKESQLIMPGWSDHVSVRYNKARTAKSVFDQCQEFICMIAPS